MRFDRLMKLPVLGSVYQWSIARRVKGLLDDLDRHWPVLKAMCQQSWCSGSPQELQRNAELARFQQKMAELKDKLAELSEQDHPELFSDFRAFETALKQLLDPESDFIPSEPPGPGEVE